MIQHLFAAELKAVADALAAGEPPAEPELAKLNRYVAQSGQTRATPGVVFQSDPERLFKGGKNGIVRVTITIESNAGDEETPAPDNHAARVTLVHRLFIVEKAARIAAIAARGKLTVDDWGQIPGRVDVVSDLSGDRLRSVVVLRAAVRSV